MTSIFPKLVASLQLKLAQYALLKHRAAVLSALPPFKGRPTYWATKPAPELLKSVVHYGGLPATANVGRLLLRTWFQKKPALRTAVSQALRTAGYPISDSAEPSPWSVRLAPADIIDQGTQIQFGPGGQRVPDAGDASLEEITLMAHLLGWSVLPPEADETPPEVPVLFLLAQVYRAHLVFRSALGILAKDALPPDVAAAVQRGELPDGAAAFWSDHWPAMLSNFAEMRAMMQRALYEPVAPDGTLLVFEEFDGLLQRFEAQGRTSFISYCHRRDALALLTRVEGLRHRQHTDFAPLAALHEHTAALRATFAEEWPLPDETDFPTVALAPERAPALLAQANVYALLLRLVAEPELLAHLDETTAEFQRLEAAVPPAVLNAVLLGRLAASG